MVKRSFNRNWFSNWHWLHYDSSQDLSFCHTCVKAVNEGKLSLASGNIKDSPFVCGGFSNWKDATVAFARHEQTTTHKKAVEVLVTIPETTRDIGEMLSTAHAEGKKISGQCLITIAENIRFLARQGIALRGDEDEKDSNFIQLLHLLAIKQPELINWMQQKTSKYTSAQIQNELLSIMGSSVVRDIAAKIQNAKHFCIMADEVTDASNKEQVVVCFRTVDEEFVCSEDFVGVYVVETTKSDTIVHILKDTLIRMNLPITNCRGQCYDGAANMAGHRNGVAAQILAEESRATYTHCYGHALNLAASDMVKKNKILRDTLDTVFEISKLVKFSPKREAIFNRLKSELAPSTPGFRTLCPTRWTVRALSLQSVIDNYEVLNALWDTVKDSVTDSEVRARIIGIEATMSRFDFLFGAVLGERLLKHTDNLSRTLQSPALTASEAQQCAMLTCETLCMMRSSESFDLFWERVILLQEKYGVQEPLLPRKRKAPTHLEVGSSTGYFHITVKELYRQQYFECLDLVISAVRERFDQPGYAVLLNLESLLLKAVKKEEYSEELHFVLKHYHDDFADASRLETQLELLGVMFSSTTEKLNPTLDTVKYHVSSLSLAQRASISDVCSLLKLIYVTPATNAVSERSASVLRRVKTYLRSTMTQMRLNNIMILHAHKERTDALSIPSCLNEFVALNDHRLDVFGKF